MSIQSDTNIIYKKLSSSREVGIPSDFVYLNTGPRRPIELKNNKPINLEQYIETSYRVGFILSEIYYSLSIEEINWGNEERDPEVEMTYFINVYKLWSEEFGNKEKGEAIVNIKFIKWENWNTFILKIHGDNFRFQIRETTNTNEHDLVISQDN
ncbi:MAG: hypothetical protein HRT90_09935 [Candidatus Margulisbacteria bacterium]|nr:hypothetical protein [Candidatus Margulisiibacteriota bacterium]